MIRKLCALGIVLGLTSAAHAAAFLNLTNTVSLGGGLTQYTFTVSADDNANISFGAAVTFTGTINQVKFNGSTDVNDSGTAQSLDGLLGYSKAQDSWFYSPWSTSNPFIQTATTYGITAGGTGGGSQFNSLPFAQIVANGNVTWTGTISRNGVDYPTSGTTSVPEPASLALLAMGALGLISRRRRI